jgi:hypothetical protein
MLRSLTHTQPLPALHGTKAATRNPNTTPPLLHALHLIKGSQRASLLLQCVFQRSWTPVSG